MNTMRTLKARNRVQRVLRDGGVKGWHVFGHERETDVEAEYVAWSDEALDTVLEWAVKVGYNRFKVWGGNIVILTRD